MTFDEWWAQQPKDVTAPITPRMAWKAGQKAERAACAKLCAEATFEDFWTDDADYDGGMLKGADVCAKAIRERGEKK